MVDSIETNDLANALNSSSGKERQSDGVVSPALPPATPEKPKTVRQTLEKNFSEIEKKEKTADPQAKPEEKTTAQRDRDGAGKFVVKNPDNTNKSEIPLSEKPPEKKAVPQGIPKELHQEWDKVPENIQKFISSREAEIHKALTTNDGDRSFGKSLKEVIQPYMPLISSEGSDPVKAVQNLLNTAYRLRNSSPLERGILLWQLAHQYEADMRINPEVLKQRIAGVQPVSARQAPQINVGDLVRQHIQEEKAKSEIETFASNSDHVHFETVKPAMATLLKNGMAATLEDAYEKACWADPNIRSTLIASQTVARTAETEEEKAKRMAQVQAKTKAARNASASITGSPGLNGSTDSKKKGLTTRQLLEKNWDAVVTH